MTSTTAPRRVTPSASVLLKALTAAGVPAFYDEGDDVIYAHPDSVTQDQTFHHAHVMINWTKTYPDSIAETYVAVTLWKPDGLTDFDQINTLYATPGQGPLAEEAQRAAQAAADWMANRRADGLLLNALAEYGLLPARGALMTPDQFDTVCALAKNGTPPVTGVLISADRIDIPISFGHGEWGRLSIADRACSVQHVPSVHTGWSMFLHDEHGEPVGDPVFISGGNDAFVDCAADSAELAAAAADWVTAPVSRHCDCYNNEQPGRPHDRECNRYAHPRTDRDAA